MMCYGNTQQLWAMKATLSPAQVAANTTAEQTFNVPGLRLSSDFISAVSKPTAQAGLGIVGWRVSANDTLAITFSNNTGAGITPTASEDYLIQVARIDGSTAKTAIAR